MEARRAWLVGGGFALGLVAALALLHEASPVAEDPLPLVVRVTNVGTLEALVNAQASEVLGETLARWSFTVPPGQTVERAVEDAGRTQVVARVFVETRQPTGAGRGDAQTFGPKEECADGDAILALFEVDTTRGVSFPKASITCGPR